MARDHYIAPTVPVEDSFTVRLGASAAAYTVAELGKFAKHSAESAYALCAAGNPIEAVITSVELAPQNAFSIGAVCDNPKFVTVTFDGAQGNVGVGAISLGTYVVCGTVVAKDTALTAPPKVCSATSQSVSFFNWRVVSLGTVGTGAVGTVGVIQRV